MRGGPAAATGLTLEEGPGDRKAIDTLCALSLLGVGPATAAGAGARDRLATIAYTVWQGFLRFDPEDPLWPNRDRLLLCEGRGAELLPALLHLAGVKAATAQHERELEVTLADLERSGRHASEAAGPLEAESIPGEHLLRGTAVQRLETSIRLALGARELALRFNRPGLTLFDYDVYGLCGDGCFEEPAEGEAASLAAARGVSNLCWICDAPAPGAERTRATGRDLAERFRGHGWNVLGVGDACDTDALSAALGIFRATNDRPTLIVAAGRTETGRPADAELRVPPGVREHFRDGAGRRGKALRNAWFARFEEHRRANPDLAEEIERLQPPTPARKA